MIYNRSTTVSMAAVVVVAVMIVSMPSTRATAVHHPPSPKINVLQTHVRQSVRITVDQGFCPNLCSGRGKCVKNEDPNAPPENTALCVCDQGWSGDDCSRVMLEPHLLDDGTDCLNNCSSHGVCYRGSSVTRSRCFCDQGYTGIDCSRIRSELLVCPKNCSGYGVCVTGFSERFGNLAAVCMCDSFHGGEDCSRDVATPCPRGCSGKGQCTKNGCRCKSGFTGSDCGLIVLPECPNHCSSRGRCGRDGKCTCATGWAGEDCSQADVPVCPGEPPCSGRGRCVGRTDWFDGGCKCDKGWGGKACEFERARILKGQNCPRGWGGKGGNKLALCSGHGHCRATDDACECEAGWDGLACELRTDDTFDSPPSAHPHFMPGRPMQLNANKTGIEPASAAPPGCPNNCSSHGVCHLLMSGVSDVYDESTGEIKPDEREKLAKKSKTYVCRCDPGYVGPDCSRLPPSNLGLAAANSAEAQVLKQPKDPKLVGLYTEDSTHWDELPTVTELRLRALGCPNNCSSRGRCNTHADGTRSCSCYQGWLGIDCSRKAPPTSCPLDCGDHGRCAHANEWFPMRCLCSDGYKGEQCETAPAHEVQFKGEPGMCPNQCSYRGPCVHQQCVCLDLSWGGPDCSIPAGGVCKDNCNGNGICYFGFCGCLGGYSGETCAVEPATAPCPNDCNMRGKCVGGVCMCTTGYTGDDCSDIIVRCPGGGKCSGHGTCNEADVPRMKPAMCECAAGWTGPDCANFPHSAEAEAKPVVLSDSESSLAAQEANEQQRDTIEAGAKVAEQLELGLHR